MDPVTCAQAEMEPDNGKKFTILFPHPICMKQFDRAMAKCKLKGFELFKFFCLKNDRQKTLRKPVAAAKYYASIN